MPDTESTVAADRKATAWATFKNVTKGIKGVNSVGGIINVDPGQTSRPLEIAEHEAQGLVESGFFEIKGVSGPGDVTLTGKGVEDGSEENSTAHREGNPVKPATADDIVRAALAGGGMEVAPGPDDFDKMEDDALRAFITERDGKAPHPNTGREKLLAKARGAAEEEAV